MGRIVRVPVAVLVDDLLAIEVLEADAVAVMECVARGDAVPVLVDEDDFDAIVV